MIQLMTKFPVVSEEDYGICVTEKNKPGHGEWLEDTKKLSIYKSLKNEVSPTDVVCCSLFVVRCSLFVCSLLFVVGCFSLFFFVGCS